MKKIGLTLGGGGARGLCHIEFLKVLDELEIKPSIISGTSMGAIIGAMYASGMNGQEIENILQDIDFKILLKMVDFSFLSRASLIKGKKVEEFLSKHIPVKYFEDLQIPLKIVATDYWKADDVVFDSGKLLPAIRASISIPALFEPVNYNNMILIDGGVTNNLPFDIIRKECDVLIAIDVSGSKSIPDVMKAPTWFDNMMNSYEILQASIVEFQMKISKPDIYIKPQLLDVKILDFEKANMILESVDDDVAQFRKEIHEKLNLSMKIQKISKNLKNKIKDIEELGDFLKK
ncbi:MAG: patatin-like phospholipase family protein [Candidatus Tenebribacter davisii]|nr:patatin-like phospholipase family protein [Candidatus Tenebribacter davisii]